MRVWIAGQSSGDGTPRVVLPSLGKPDSEFAREIGDVLAPKNCWFNYGEQVVTVRVIRLGDDYECFGFHPITPVEAGTNLEQYLQTGRLKRDGAGDEVFVPQSLRREAASYLLSALQLLERLPKVTRILDTPLPILKDNKIVYPKPGYNADLKCYINPQSPVLSEINFDDGLQLIEELLDDFCFADDQAKTNAVAKLMSPYCRGLMGWSARMPLWVFEANRERSGKDYLCELLHIVHEGRSSSHPAFENDAELRKKITSALLAGARRMHFGNVRGHVASKALEQAITSKHWEDRILGGNQNQTFPNEIEFSMSTNVGTTWTPDLEHRMIIIDLFLARENPNDRTFKHPNLHQWARERRPEILSTLAAFIRRWDAAGRPDGSASFASFPEWAKVVGGIMEACNLGTPRQPSNRGKMTGGDETTEDMKTLYRAAHEQFDSEWASKKQLYELAKQLELFSWWDIEDRKGQTAFGKAINRFNGRHLGGIVLEAGGAKNNRRYRFSLVNDDPKVVGDNEGTSGTSNEVHSGVKPEKPPTPSSKQGTSGTLGTSTTLQEVKNIGIYTEEETEGNAELLYAYGVKQVPNVPDVPAPQYRVLTDSSLLGEVAAIIRKAGDAVALDIETYGNGLNPWRGDIRLLSLAIPEHPAWLLDLKAIGYDLGELGKCLQERQVIAHNAKFDLLWLRHKCGLKLDNVFCTLTAARLLSNGKRELRNGLYACWERFLGLNHGEDQGKSDWGGMFLTEDQFEYAALDVLHLHRLRDKQLEAITAEQLQTVLDLENRLIPVVVEMENRGFGINKERLLGVMEDYSTELKKALDHFKKDFGEEINPNSPKQVKEAFVIKGLKLSNTSEQTLKEEDQPLTACVLNYRSAKKQMEQAETLLKAIEEDGRIHARFEPTGTDTGRFSSKKPNLQNIGRGKLRGCFTPASGNRLVVADYSQVELRVAAVIANEKRMIEAYKNGEDLHRQTASIVLGKPVEDISKEDRQLAKAVNFGLLYGQSAKGLVGYAKKAYGVEMDDERARDIRSRFFSAYTGLREWHRNARKVAAESTQSVRTVSGRVQWLRGGKEAKWPRFTSLVNTPVQGGSADALKQAMVDLSDKLPHTASIVSTVHDELIVECASDTAEEVKALLETAMLDAVQTMFPGVRFEVEAGICESWAEK
jgi:DNA polymerase I-like protein with 3'-5' exonuclease and polymerase domains